MAQGEGAIRPWPGAMQGDGALYVGRRPGAQRQRSALAAVRKPAASDLGQGAGGRGRMGVRTNNTVGELVADALAVAAETFLAVQSSQDTVRAQLDHQAEVCRRIAPIVERSPTSGCRNAIGPDDLEGRFTPPTERTWSLSEVAAWLLEEARVCVQAGPATSQADRIAVAETAALLRHVADLARIAPAGRLAELGELMPYLRRLHEVSELGGGASGWSDGALRMVLETPDFYDVASRAYRAAYGREFSDLAPWVQVTWAGVLVQTWKADRGRSRSPLSPGEREAIAYAVTHPRQDWSRTPLTGEGWVEQAPAEATELRHYGATHQAPG